LQTAQSSLSLGREDAEGCENTWRQWSLSRTQPWQRTSGGFS